MRPASVAATLAVWAIAAFGQRAPSPQPQRTAPAQKTEQNSELQKAIDEFRVQTRTLGIRPDSPVKAQRKNRGGWHGRVFENIRNDFFDAVAHEIRQRNEEKGILRRNQFGFNLTGPVWIPKIYDGGQSTHFSLTYEGMREKVNRTYLRTIPTMLERTGDWGHVVDQSGDLLPIFDPLSTAVNPNFDPSAAVSLENLQYNRAQFPNNRIPASRLDRTAQDVLRFYPEPNANAGPFFRNNFFISAPEPNRADGIVSRVDHTLNDKHRLGASINYSNGSDGAAPWFNSPANPGSVPRERKTRRLSVDHVFTASAKNINTLTVDISTDQSENKPNLDGSGQPFPMYGFSGTYLGMGQSYPQSKNVRNTFVVTDGFSTRWKEHRLRVVLQGIREQVNTYWPMHPSGSHTFGAGYTSLPGIINTGHPFASFLLGGVESADKSIVISPSYFRRSRGFIGLRDHWEVRKGLTLSLALNFDGSTPRVERYDRQSTVSDKVTNPVNGRPGGIAVAGQGGFGRSFQPLQFKAEPSASLSWNVLGRTQTVLRAGYSRSYSATPIYLGQWGTQAFNGTLLWVSLNPQLSPAFRLQDGFPPSSRVFPDVRPDSANFTVADLIEPTGKQPTYQSFSLSLEHEIPGAAVLTTGFGHSEGRNMFLSNSGSNPNAIHLDNLVYRDRLNDELFNRSLRPYPQYQKFDVYSSWPEGRYKRDAGYLRLEKRASAGLTVSAYYEFSKQMDNYSGPYGIQDYFNRRNEWALTSSNNPHRFSLSYNYELPSAVNRFLPSQVQWARFVMNGWSISGQTTVASGEPVALRPAFNNTGRLVEALNVNAVPEVNFRVENPSPDMWFNPAAFSQPEDFTTGNASRTHPHLRMPRNQNHDLSLIKRIPITQEKSMELSAVGLNFINHADWTEPDTVIGPPSAPNVNAGKIIGSRGGRVIQLGLRVNF